jgi:hypothetical protein
MFVSGTVFVMAIPPLSFFRTTIAGGFLFSRMPKPSSSASMVFLSPRGLRTSRTMNMRLHVRATKECDYGEPQARIKHSYVTTPAMTVRYIKIVNVRRWFSNVPCRPLPRPSFAPSIIPAEKGL